MDNEKDMRLVNIYIKIHNKKTLTLDDLAYLAKYNPECFKKTCENLILNIPETKPLVTGEEAKEKAPLLKDMDNARKSVENPFVLSPEEKERTEKVIRDFLSNLSKMEDRDEAVSRIQNVDVEQVKDLVGNLYMEMMFPHNGRQGYFEMYDKEPASTFNVKA